jgi:charged multivesicular body protein 5
MLRALFGPTPPVTPAPSLEAASESTARREQSITSKVTELDKQLTAYGTQLKAAKSAAAKNTIKQRAVQVLQRKRLYENQLRQLQGMAMNMESAKFAVETVRENISVAQAMRATTAHIKSHAVDVSQFEDIMDDLQDAMHDADEINELMGRSYGVEADVDEDALEAELAGLDEQLQLDEEVGEVPAYLMDTAVTAAVVPVDIALPSVPSNPLPAS